MNHNIKLNSVFRRWDRGEGRRPGMACLRFCRHPRLIESDPNNILRLSRLAVLDGALLAGSIGAIGNERLARVRLRLAKWVASDV